jgi:hypothetical protein
MRPAYRLENAIQIGGLPFEKAREIAAMGLAGPNALSQARASAQIGSTCGDFGP